jgi:hypothetical protein
MTQPWQMHVVVDARDSDTLRVGPRRFGGGPQVHLAVRTGPLLVYCLDGAAIRTIAAAWAQAQASSAHLLPERQPEQRRAAPARKGAAWPVADVVAEGPQRWDVTAPQPRHPFATITTDWLTVRIYDRAALHTYTHAWAGACALGIRMMPNPPVAFDMLLRDAYDRDYLTRYHREHPHEGRNRER